MQKTVEFLRSAVLPWMELHRNISYFLVHTDWNLHIYFKAIDCWQENSSKCPYEQDHLLLLLALLNCSLGTARKQEFER